MDSFSKYLLDNNLDDANLTLSKVLVHKSNGWTLNVRGKDVLDLESFIRFNSTIIPYFSEPKIKVKYLLTYDNDISEQLLKEYYKYFLTSYTVNYRFLTFETYKTEFIGQNINVYVEKKSSVLSKTKDEIVELFKSNGININLSIIESTEQSVKSLKEEMVNNHFLEMKNNVEIAKQNVVNESKKPSKDIKTGKSFRRNSLNDKSVPISTIPATQMEIDDYINNCGTPDFIIEGEVFDIATRKLTNMDLVQIKITDNSDSILVKIFVKTDKDRESIEDIKIGSVIKVSGKAVYDSYSKEVNFTSYSIRLVGEKQIEKRKDLASVKRVELHCHTKMSTMDAITSAADYLKEAANFGHKAIAFTDHNGVYSIPDIAHNAHKYDIKPIYGLETGLVDEKKFNIAFTDHDLELKDATFVVFDIETTGFSAEYDAVIEIGAVKIHHGQVIETFEEIIDPKRQLPEVIVKLTNITEDMLVGCRTIDQVLPDFLQFAQNSIVIGQNVSFDIGHIYANIDRLNLTNPNWPIIDTMQFARNFYSDQLKRFDLKTLCRFFKVKQESHHRADDDARVTGEIFLQMLEKLNQLQVTNYNQINSKIDVDNVYKYCFPKHVNLLTKTQAGYKNLFKIVSDVLTNHFYREGRLLKSVLEQYRDGILVGSSCSNGEVFETALNKSYSELISCMDFYDYIEVLPPGALKHLEDNMVNGKEIIKLTIKKIIKAANELGKIVVATGDCHYLTKDLQSSYDIYVRATQPSGMLHSLSRYKTRPMLHFRTTDEMLSEFSFLGPDLAYEIVVTNTNKVADMCEEIIPFRKELFSPADDEFKDSLNIPSIEGELKRLVYEKTHRDYGNDLPQIVIDRLEKELGSIISNKFSPVYYMSHLLVKKSLDDGYLVGSRGSVGSSFVATMMDITEVNPMPPHYRCKNGDFTSFKMKQAEVAKYGIRDNEKHLVEILNSVESGYDLPDQKCPICGEYLIKDGQDIPFETFLGFKGDKVPDIDLNFSGKYQPIAHEYIRSIMGEDRAFRAGTLTTVAENTAIGYVKGYLEDNGIQKRNVEISRMAKKIEGAKRSTGQHPGGIVVVPKAIDIFDVTPIQFPADKTDNNWRTTHFDYHSFEANLLKLDILGHDDPTTIRFLFDYVDAHPEEFPFKTPQEIPLDDVDVYKLFNQTEIIGVSPLDINSDVATYAIPEFGTRFTRQMLKETKPKSFADLVKISGLSHGTDVWSTNGQALVAGTTEFGKIPFKDVIGCRDDIMEYLIWNGVESKVAFDIMEFVRKGKAAKKSDPAKWEKYSEILKENNIPHWYIWSCEKIAYMFPKAHAVAYVIMALRIAWFKLHRPLVFYSAFFSVRAGQFEPKIMLEGERAIRNRIADIQSLKKTTAKEDDLLTMFSVALEMLMRGMSFLPVDINLSHSTDFVIEGNSLRLPFISVEGLGESVAIGIISAREEAPFTSKEDVGKRTKINKSVFETMNLMKSFGDLKDEDEILETGLFAL